MPQSRLFLPGSDSASWHVDRRGCVNCSPVWNLLAKMQSLRTLRGPAAVIAVLAPTRAGRIICVQTTG